MNLASDERLVIEVINLFATQPSFHLTTEYNMLLSGLMNDDTVLENKYVALFDVFSNVLRFIKNNVTFKTYEQIVFGCIIEYFAGNYSILFLLDDEGLLNFIIYFLVDYEIKHEIETNNRKML